METWAELLGPGVVCAEAAPEELDAPEELSPEERAVASRCARKRRIEYTATRVLARRAFQQLGFGPHPLLNHQDRSPLWPPGVVGSVTHTSTLCAIAVARHDEVRSLGIDAEQDTPLSDDLLERIVRADEADALQGVAAEQGVSMRILGKLVFSAKEAVYKCQYPLTRTFLGFHDVHLHLDWEARRFHARISKSGIEEPAVSAGVNGRFARRNGLWLTASRV